MSALTPTIAHRQARNQATLDLLDTGAGAARIDFYTAAAGTLLATRTLQNPSGTLNAAGRIVLAQAATTDLVAASGSATYAELVSADDVVLGSGDVTDSAGSGVFKLAGGTALVKDGVLLLTEPALLG